MTNKIVHFELLAVDTLNKSVIFTEKNLLFSLMGNGQLCQSPVLKNDMELADGSNSFSVRLLSADDDVRDVLNKAFAVSIKGPHLNIEPLRVILVEHLKSQNFDYLYILTDKVSEHIACELYPLIYEVENSLRHYLIKFMVTRLGPNWWNVTATRDVAEKVNKRRNNETLFEDKIDNRAYLIDFGELGQMIYAHSSGFTTKEDILKRVMGLEETPEAIRALKEQLQSNYQKFFKESFKDKGFQEKWEGLEKLRHKIAHNSLFSAKDLDEGKALAQGLINIMRSADKTVETIKLETQEKEAIKESFVSRGETRNVISESNFVEELIIIEGRYNRQKNGFVGLAHFVKNHLGAKGYDFSSSYDVAEKLDIKGIVELYEVPNIDGDHPVKAIRLLKIPLNLKSAA